MSDQPTSQQVEPHEMCKQCVTPNECNAWGCYALSQQAGAQQVAQQVGQAEPRAERCFHCGSRDHSSMSHASAAASPLPAEQAEPLTDAQIRALNCDALRDAFNSRKVHEAAMDYRGANSLDAADAYLRLRDVIEARLRTKGAK